MLKPLKTKIVVIAILVTAFENTLHSSLEENIQHNHVLVVHILVQCIIHL